MKKLILIVLITIIICSAFAKRIAPPEVQPIEINNTKYYANFKTGFFSGKGIIEVYDIETSKKENEITIYNIFYNILIEKDAQWVFISKMDKINNNTIRITNEKNDIYDFNINKRKVMKIKE